MLSIFGTIHENFDNDNGAGYYFATFMLEIVKEIRIHILVRLLHLNDPNVDIWLQVPSPKPAFGQPFNFHSIF